MKYKLTDNKKEHCGKTLYQIQALRDIPTNNVKTGDLGGFIEKDSNLDQNGGAWVSGNAQVYGDAQVYGGAKVYGYAQVSGSAKVYGYAQVSDNALVYDNAWVYGNALVYDNARVSGSALVSSNARVSGNAVIKSKLDLSYMQGLKFDLTLTNAGLSIGCEFHSIEHWLLEYRQIGAKHKLTEKETRHYLKLIKTADKILKAQQELK